MSKSCKLCWGLSILLLAAVLAMAYLFLLRGNVTASDDGRTAIVVTLAERDMVLGDMRGFLETVQAVTEAAAAGDLTAAAAAAHANGMASTRSAPTTFLAKLPLEFKTLGFATHGLFDDLAKTATDSSDPKPVFAALGNLMLNCTGCHAGYKFVTEKSTP